jgi:glutaconate CoA-transferase subunit A
MTDIVPLSQAIEKYVVDGASVALEGFTHLIPFAAAHEIIRQRRRDLTLIRMTPDLIYDQMIGMGCARALTFSWGGNPGVGSLHRFRDAVENAWPHPLTLNEHSHAAMANAYAAGASNLPVAIFRGYKGTDLTSRNASAIRALDCPFTGETLAAVPSIRPDVGIVHAQQADRHGNVHLWGIVGVQKEVVLASRRSIVTVEEVVDSFPLRANSLILPHWVIDAVAVAPRGSYPSYALGYYDRDNRFYTEWDEISRDRERFLGWMNRHVLAAANVLGQRQSYG